MVKIVFLTALSFCYSFTMGQKKDVGVVAFTKEVNDSLVIIECEATAYQDVYYYVSRIKCYLCSYDVCNFSLLLFHFDEESKGFKSIPCRSVVTPYSVDMARLFKRSTYTDNYSFNRKQWMKGLYKFIVRFYYNKPGSDVRLFSDSDPVYFRN